MRWTFPDGTVANGFAEAKRICAERGLDVSYLRRREQRGQARRKGGPRNVRLPADWRKRLNDIFGPDAVSEFTRAIPTARPSIVFVTNATDTAWWRQLAQASAAVCFIRGRVNYVDVDLGKQLKGNPRGSTALLFADSEADISSFITSMRSLGVVGRPAGGADG